MGSSEREEVPISSHFLGFCGSRRMVSRARGGHWSNDRGEASCNRHRRERRDRRRTSFRSLRARLRRRRLLSAGQLRVSEASVGIGASKPSGWFMTRNRIRVVKRHPRRRLVSLMMPAHRFAQLGASGPADVHANCGVSALPICCHRDREPAHFKSARPIRRNVWPRTQE
jgi:hypothetical protein